MRPTAAVQSCGLPHRSGWRVMCGMHAACACVSGERGGWEDGKLADALHSLRVGCCVLSSCQQTESVHVLRSLVHSGVAALYVSKCLELLTLPCCWCCCCCCASMDRYGYHLAEGAVGRGKGSRSLLRQALLLPATRDRKSRFYQPAAAAAGASAAASAAGNASTAVAGTAATAAGPVTAVVHDASYWGCLQLEGQQQQLVQLLGRLRCAGLGLGERAAHRHRKGRVYVIQS